MAQRNRPQVKNDDRYEKLKEKGMSKEKAARIANTSNPGKKGGGSRKYEDRSKKELMEKAAKIGIKGRSNMRKSDLISALRKR